jgi:hypothetical protein
MNQSIAFLVRSIRAVLVLFFPFALVVFSLFFGCFPFKEVCRFLLPLYILSFLFVKVLCEKDFRIKRQGFAKKKKPELVRLYFDTSLLLVRPPLIVGRVYHWGSGVKLLLRYALTKLAFTYYSVFSFYKVFREVASYAGPNSFDLTPCTPNLVKFQISRQTGTFEVYSVNSK